MPRTIASFHFTACSPSPSNAAIIGVLVGPGHTAFRSTFFRASSRAIDLVKEITPPLPARVPRLCAGADAGRVGRDIDDAPAAMFDHQRRNGVVGVERTIEID